MITADIIIQFIHHIITLCSKNGRKHCLMLFEFKFYNTFCANNAISEILKVYHVLLNVKKSRKEQNVVTHVSFLCFFAIFFLRNSCARRERSLCFLHTSIKSEARQAASSSSVDKVPIVLSNFLCNLQFCAASQLLLILAMMSKPSKVCVHNSKWKLLLSKKRFLQIF